MIHLRTLGTLELHRADGTELLSVLAQPKRLALLIYLAAARPRAFHRRDTLLGLFWEEADQERARAALNQSVYYLRRSLGSGLVVNRGDEELGVDTARLWCDAVEFQRQLDAGDVRKGLDLYGGDLLPGFFLQNAAGWERWVEGERARLRQRAADAAWTVADSLEEKSNPVEAARWARRAVTLAPDDEVQLRRLIVLLDRAGDRVGAIRALDEAADRFAREYGIQLSAETRSLVGRMRPSAGRSGTAATTEQESPIDSGHAPLTDASHTAGDPSPAHVEGRRGWRWRQWKGLRVGGLAAILIALLTGWLLLQSTTHENDGRAAASRTVTGADRLAVRPLVDLSADPEDGYLADWMTEELITRLSQLADLRVIARSSVMAYHDTGRSAAEMGRELEARFVLEGSVRTTSDRMRISLQLVDAEAQEQLWAESYDADIADALALQSEIALQVGRALSVRLGPGERTRLTRRGTADPEAKRAYLRGRYLLGKSDTTSFRAARDQFQRALDLDPSYALAWSGLSDAYDHLAGMGAMTSAEGYPRARAAAERALELDAELGAAHASLAMSLTHYYWDSDRAEHHFQRAIELEPSNARARRVYAGHLRNLGRFDEAIAQARAARDLDPIPFFSHFELLIIPYFQRDYDETIARAERLARIDPSYAYAHFLRALALVQKRRFAEASAALDEVDPEHTFPDAQVVRAYIHGRTGRRDEARRVLQSYARGSTVDLDGFQKAVIYLGLGATDLAMGSLEEAYEARSSRLRLLGFEPIFDPLRSNPRFRALLRNVGLGEVTP